MICAKSDYIPKAMLFADELLEQANENFTKLNGDGGFKSWREYQYWVVNPEGQTTFVIGASELIFKPYTVFAIREIELYSDGCKPKRGCFVTPSAASKAQENNLPLDHHLRTSIIGENYEF